MNCYEFDLIVLALARSRLMDAAQRERGLAHAASCVRCDRRLAAERTLFAAVSATVSELAREEAPARVEANLLEAFHEHTMTAPLAITETVRTDNWSARWRLAAVAATILVLASASAIFWLYSNSFHREREPQPISAGPVMQPEPQTLPVEREAASNNASAQAQREVHHRILRRKSIAPEVVTEFYPLMEAADLEDSDSLLAVQVVRVELPASALAAAGLSVGSEMSNEPVKADVVLGADGLARSIRFVR
jgi:hypothetical protein